MVQPHTRRFIYSLAIFSLLAIPGFAQASATIEERLAALEKQVATLSAENTALREAAKPAKDAKDAPATVQAGGKESKLLLGGFLHLHAESGSAPDSRFSGINDRFLVRRARVNVRGSFGKDFGFKVESDFGANSLSAVTGYRAQLTDLYVEWLAHPEAQLRLGQFKTPFGWEQLMSDTANPFTERSLPSDRLTVSRQIGVMLFGSAAEKRVEYSAGVFNGNGVNNSNNDTDDFMAAARLAATVWSGKHNDKAALWSVGVNAFGDEAPARRTGLGFDTQLQLHPVTLRAEWLTNTLDPVTGADVDSDGWSLAALWSLNDQWQLAARYETYDSNTATGGNETDTLTLGLNWFIRRNDIAVSLNYLAGDAKFGGGDDRLIGRLQLVF
ncbi:MAG: phosphate-selective porin OprO and OprP [Verrucomicrobiota bacterium]|nr:phosphate-selective porin OprO and OprP [Verrucomicrobiota bacterium]